MPDPPVPNSINPVERHGMIPGSHERPDGPECFCGREWLWWNDRCSSQPSVDVEPTDNRVSGLGTCSKCDDHNNACVCRMACACEGPHRPPASTRQTLEEGR